MTSRERLLVAYRGGKPDRVPVFVRGVYCEPDGSRVPSFAGRHESFADLFQYVFEHADLIRFWEPGPHFLLSGVIPPTRREVVETGPDYEIIRTTIETPRGPLTSLYRRSTVGHPGLQLEHPVRTPEDVERVLSLPEGPVEFDADTFHRMDAEMGDRGLVAVNCLVPAGELHGLLGSERLAFWSIERRDLLGRLLEVLGARWRRLLDDLIAARVGPVFTFLGQELVTPPLLSPTDFHEFVTLVERPGYEAIHAAGGIVRIHCHGNLKAVLEEFLEVGCDALHPVETPPWGDITYPEFRRRVGTRICIKGGVQIADLQKGPPERIAAICRQVIDEAGRDGALILATSASPFWPVNTPEITANYRAMIETALTFGRYPIG